jgi:uroporphyrinogen-III synthase
MAASDSGSERDRFYNFAGPARRRPYNRDMTATPTSPLRVCSFESRRAEEMASLLRRQGCDPTVAPSMQEVPLEDNSGVLKFAQQLLAHRFDAIIFLTGVGARAMLEIAEQQLDREELLKALRLLTTIVRGPKPAAVLREWQVPIRLRAPEPNTWEEVLLAIDASDLSMEGCRIGVQEYGESNEQLCAALRLRGALVTPVTVYRWSLPDDTAPLEAAIAAAIDSPFDLLLFTSAQQVRHVLEVAARLGVEDRWRAGAARSVVASIGPTCSEALRETGLHVDLEPSHPKMGTLVREAVSAAPRLLSAR